MKISIWNCFFYFYSSTSSDDNRIRKSEQTQMSEADYQHLLRISYEKQREQIHEVIYSSDKFSDKQELGLPT